MNQIAKIEPRAVSVVPTDADKFSLMQRQASLYASSPLIPESLRAGGQQVAMANCYIGLQMAEAMGENPLVVLQNMQVIKGKAGFSAQFMIARANGSGVFKDGIDWEQSGQGESLVVTAFATLASTGRRVSFTVSMAMAKAEGWSSNAKYRSMPDLMLRYRSGTLLVRLYAPQVMFGYQTSEEIIDVLGSHDSATVTVHPEQVATSALAAFGPDDEDDEPDDTTPAAVVEATGDEPKVETGEAAAPVSGGFDLGEPEHYRLGAEIESKLKLATSVEALASSWKALHPDLKRLQLLDAGTYDALVALKERMKADFAGEAA